MVYLKTPHCYYDQPNDQIHRLVFLHASNQSVDEFFATWRQILAEEAGTKQVLGLVDFRPDGMPPAFHFIDQMRSFFEQHTDPPSIRIAYLFSQPSMMRATAIVFERMKLNLHCEFFYGEGVEQAALNWLQQPQPAPHLRYRNFFR